MADDQNKFTEQPPCEKILSQALQLAQHQDWESIRLVDVARELGIPLDSVYDCYRQKDELTDALLNRADRAMLEHCTNQDFQNLELKLRLKAGIQSWLLALSPHRLTLRQMLKYKLEFGHVHLQVGGLLRLSRTVQWLREATHCDSRELHRVIEEVGLSAIFSVTFLYWLYDNSAEHQNTWNKLDSLLNLAERGVLNLQSLFLLK